MPRKYKLPFFTKTKRHSRSRSRSKSRNRSSFVSYKRRLSDFYKELNFFHFMSNKREIARQDVLITDKGPVELYRRDANGREKHIEPESVLASNIDRRSKSYLRKIYGSGGDYEPHGSMRHPRRTYSTIYDSHSAYSRPSSVHRDPKGRYGFAFDWYEPSAGRVSRVLHEDLHVLPHGRHSRRIEPTTYSSYRSSGGSYTRPSSYYSHSNSYYDDDDHHPPIDKRDYKVYEYYEYDVASDSERHSRRRGRNGDNRQVAAIDNHHYHRRHSRTPSPAGLERGGELPVAPLRRNKKKDVSYIDYDAKDRKKKERRRGEGEKANKQSLSSSASGKELWNKVDTYSRVGGTAAIEETPVSPRHMSNDDNFILVPNNNNNNRNHEPQHDDDYSGNIAHSSASSSFKTNFKKRSSNNSIQNTAAAASSQQHESTRFNDLPGNDVLRTNPLFDTKNDQFIY